MNAIVSKCGIYTYLENHRLLNYILGPCCEWLLFPFRSCLVSHDISLLCVFSRFSVSWPTCCILQNSGRSSLINLALSTPGPSSLPQTTLENNYQTMARPLMVGCSHLVCQWLLLCKDNSSKLPQAVDTGWQCLPKGDTRCFIYTDWPVLYITR